jgi:hypothetical protein
MTSTFESATSQAKDSRQSQKAGRWIPLEGNPEVKSSTDITDCWRLTTFSGIQFGAWEY